MNVIINGETTSLEKDTLLLDFLDSKDLNPSQVVVEYNESIISAEQLDDIILKEKDKLEIISFVGGGC